MNEGMISGPEADVKNKSVIEIWSVMGCDTVLVAGAHHRQCLYLNCNTIIQYFFNSILEKVVQARN